MSLLDDLPRIVLLSALGLAALPALILIAACILYCALLGKLSTWVTE